MIRPLAWLDPDIAAGLQVALLGVVDGFDYHHAARIGRTALRVALRVDADHLTLRYEVRPVGRPFAVATVRMVDLRDRPWHAMVLRLATEGRELWRAYRFARAEATAERARDATRVARTRTVAHRHAARAERAAHRAVLLAASPPDAGQACAYADEALDVARYRPW